MSLSRPAPLKGSQWGSPLPASLTWWNEFVKCHLIKELFGCISYATMGQMSVYCMRWNVWGLLAKTPNKCTKVERALGHIHNWRYKWTFLETMTNIISWSCWFLEGGMREGSHKTNSWLCEYEFTWFHSFIYTHTLAWVCLCFLCDIFEPHTDFSP